MLYGRIGKIVLKKPIFTLVATIITLGVMIFGVFGSQKSFDQLDSLPKDTESVRSFELLREGFSPGRLSPTNIFIENENIDLFDPKVVENFETLAKDILSTNLVDDVSYYVRPFGSYSDIGSSTILQAHKRNDSQLKPLFERSAQFISNDKNVVKFEVVLNVNPYSNEALDFIPKLRDVVNKSIESSSISQSITYIGGETAEAFDTRQSGDRDTYLVLPIILIAIGVILVLLLKSLVAPIYLLATIIFTYFSTLGLAIFIFENVFDQASITPGLPFFLFIFLNALGVDYNIYLMSRLREENLKANLDVAVLKTLALTGGVITSAGLILAGTFSALMSLPLKDLFQLGFAVAIGVLIDTFITRTLIVPALVKLLGRYNWWPSRQFINN